MKSKIKFLAFFMFIFLAAGQLSAESVFMKSGAVLEGKIIRENDAAVTLKNADGIISRIPRKNIQRVLYHDDYKQAKYIGTKDNKIIRGYIVAENNDGYTVRKDLKKKDELVVYKKDILYVSSKKLVLAEEKKEILPVKIADPRKPYVNRWYNNVRLGARIHYYFGWDYVNDDIDETEKYGHTGGFSLFCHWRSWEFEFLLCPKYNKESFFILTMTGAWLPVSFYRFRLGLILGYAQFADNLYFNEYNSGSGYLSKYFAFTYGWVLHFSDWLRFSQSFGVMGDVAIRQGSGDTYSGYNLLPISAFETQLEIIFMKNYSIQLKYNFTQGDGKTDTSSIRFNVSFVSLGIGYRFHL